VLGRGKLETHWAQAGIPALHVVGELQDGRHRSCSGAVRRELDGRRVRKRLLCSRRGDPGADQKRRQERDKGLPDRRPANHRIQEYGSGRRSSRDPCSQRLPLGVLAVASSSAVAGAGTETKVGAQSTTARPMPITPRRTRHRTSKAAGDGSRGASTYPGAGYANLLPDSTVRRCATRRSSTWAWRVLLRARRDLHECLCGPVRPRSGRARPRRHSQLDKMPKRPVHVWDRVCGTQRPLLAGRNERH
jgi:hypothetical protein